MKNDLKERISNTSIVLIIPPGEPDSFYINAEVPLTEDPFI